MKIKEIQKILSVFVKFFFSRTLILFILVGIFVSMFVDVKHILIKTRAKVLNRINPLEYSQFRLYLIGQEQKIDKQLVQNYVYYFEEVLHVFPEKPDALGMLGFCHYLLGDVDKSILYYKRAQINNGTFFWYYYNLGVLYIYQSKYDIAKDYFQKALKVMPEYTLLFIQSSIKIYKPLIFDLYPGRKKSEVLVSQIQKAYTDISQVINILSNADKFDAKTREMALETIHNLRLQVF